MQPFKYSYLEAFRKFGFRDCNFRMTDRFKGLLEQVERLLPVCNSLWAADRLDRLAVMLGLEAMLSALEPSEAPAAYAPLGSEQGENSLRAGLVNYDFTPKPAFRVLERLIREEWHTETTVRYIDGGDNVFHGFYGDYEIEIRTDAGTFRQMFRFTRDMLTPIRITLAN